MIKLIFPLFSAMCNFGNYDSVCLWQSSWTGTSLYVIKYIFNLNRNWSLSVPTESLAWNSLLRFIFGAGKEEGLWLHIDAAYAGAAFLCPELRCELKGVEFSDSFVFNASKWMTVHCDCAAFWWVRRSTHNARFEAQEIKCSGPDMTQIQISGSKINMRSSELSLSILLTSDTKVQRKQLTLW